MFPKNKPKRVYIEGYGIYEVRDTMNVRHNHRVDILVHPSDKKLFKKNKVKVVIL
jgi:3D (Asp-Asp-Asp) domain-containing protein